MLEILCRFQKSKNLFALAAFTFFSFYFLIFIRKFSFYAIDDAYIHLRIARNIAEHGLPYFNLNEKVLGSSPHLWINILAILLKIFSDPNDFLPFISWIFTVGSFLGCIFLLRERFGSITSIFISGLLISFLLLPSAAGLMETPLAIFLFLGAFVFLKKKFYVLAGLAAAGAVWVRFEYFALIVLSILLIQQYRNKLRYSLGAIIPLAIYFIYCFWYFGTIIPFPAISKPQVFTITVKEFFTQMPAVTNYPITSNFISVQTKFIFIVLAQTLMFLLLFVMALKKSFKDWASLMLAFSFSVLSVYVLKGVYVFSWYTPLFTIPLAIALLTITSKKYLPVLIFLFIISFINVFIIGSSDHISLATGNNKYYDEFTPGLRVQQYLEIGKELYEKYPKATLMTAEIGALGWTFQGKILDGAALVSPEILKYHPLAIPQDRDWNMAGAIPEKAVRDLHPDFIVTMPTFGRAVQREISSHSLPYDLMSSYPIIPDKESRESQIYSLWGSDRIYVYKRTTNVE